MNYFVTYGVNDSHFGEFKHFELYRDAKKFFEYLAEETDNSIICYKAKYDKHGFMNNKEVKLYKFQKGDNTKALFKYILDI